MADNRTRWGIAAAFGLLAAARILIAWQLPLTDDEAYYWTWSRALAWGYPDHPPVVAAMIRFGTALFGNSPLAIRCGPLTLTLATGVVVYALTREMFGTAAGIVAAFSSQLLPVVAAGGALAVPDVPFVFFWMLTLWLFWKALKIGVVTWWMAAGAALGLTVMSKLFGAFLALGAIGFLIGSPTDRPWLRRPQPYVAGAAALGITAPFIWWNLVQGWQSWEKIRHQIPWIRIGSPVYKASAYVAAQFAYFGVLTAPLLAFALRISAQLPWMRDRRFAFLTWTALPLFLFPFILSPSGMAKPHWPEPAYVTAGIVAAGLWWAVPGTRWGRLFAAALGVNALLLAAILLQPWIAPGALDQVYGWETVTARVGALAKALPQQPGVFIFSTGYQTASQLTYHFHGRYPVTAASADTAMARAVPLQQFVNWNGIYIDDAREPIGIPIDHLFQRVEMLPPLTVMVDGRTARRFVLYRGIGFRGMSGRDTSTHP